LCKLELMIEPKLMTEYIFKLSVQINFLSLQFVKLRIKIDNYFIRLLFNKIVLINNIYVSY
jgi:hypothetical protein